MAMVRDLFSGYAMVKMFSRMALVNGPKGAAAWTMAIARLSSRGDLDGRTTSVSTTWPRESTVMISVSSP
mgnify:CR=1 FL=1